VGLANLRESHYCHQPASIHQSRHVGAGFESILHSKAFGCSFELYFLLEGPLQAHHRQDVDPRRANSADPTSTGDVSQRSTRVLQAVSTRSLNTVMAGTQVEQASPADVVTCTTYSELVHTPPYLPQFLAQPNILKKEMCRTAGHANCSPTKLGARFVFTRICQRRIQF
jgi:hypothetical protein